MLAFAGQIPVVHRETGKRLLALGLIDSMTLLCLTEDGEFEPFDYTDVRAAWYYDPDIGVWETSQPTLQDLIDASAEVDQSQGVPEGLPEADGAGDGDPAGGPDRGEVDSSPKE